MAALVSAALLILTLVLLLFTGQTVIFLLRLVAADKRSRRTPRSASARKTVGMLEDESAAPPTADEPPSADAPPSADEPPSEDAPPSADEPPTMSAERDATPARMSHRPADVSNLPDDRD